MSKDRSDFPAWPIYLPTDPPRPAGLVLNSEEAGCFLRMKGPIEKIEQTLLYYRTLGKLTGKVVGTSVVYLLKDLIHFVENEALEYRGKQS